MPKHSRPPDEQQLNHIVENITNNKKTMSRWLAMMEGIRIQVAQEEKLGLPEQDINSLALSEYIENKSPEIEEVLLKREENPFFN